MKKLIISLTLVYAVFCTVDSCNQCYDQSQCANIKIEFEGFSCYQYECELKYNECITFPDNKKDQEAFINMSKALLKEAISSGLYSKTDIDELIIYESEKKHYSKGETIKENKKTSLSPVDKEIIASKNTCLYQLYGRYLENYNKNGYTSYPNVKDKNLCFNSDKFDEALNLIDCGYAQITFPLSGKDYTMTTCYPFPNRKMPEKVQNIYNKYFIESNFANIKNMANGVINKVVEKGELLMNKNVLIHSVEKMSEKETSKLQSTSTGAYEFIIENKYGKKYKYTEAVQEKPVVISEGNKEEEEKADDIQRIKANKSNYFKLNILFLLFLILL